MEFKHFFFDLDNTLTRSTSPLLDAHRILFERLCRERDVVVVSGAHEMQIEKQLGEKTGRYGILAQNGNVACTRDNGGLWRYVLTPEAKKIILSLIEKMKKDLALRIKDEHDLVQDRGAQITYSLIGHHEEREKKELFDPDKGRRRELLVRYSNDLTTLKNHGVEVGIGGTTCFDFFSAGSNKGNNVRRFALHYTWELADCVYFGDALFPGGNDESVIGIIATKPVRDYHETFAILRTLLP